MIGRLPAQGPVGRREGGFLSSALLMTICYLAMVMPLAVYHVAQLACTGGLRRAALLLLAVPAALLFFGVVLNQQLFVATGALGVAYFPIVVTALWARSEGRSRAWALVAFLVPVCAAVALCFVLPIQADLVAQLRSLSEDWLKQVGPSAPRGNMPSRESLDAILASPEIVEVARLAASGPAQRLAWLAFGSGAGLLLGLLMSAFGNFLFLDLGFEQVERLRAAVAYVLAHPARFPRAAGEGLDWLVARLGMLRGADARFEVLQSVPLPQGNEEGVSLRLMGEAPRKVAPRWLRLLVRPAERVLVLWGNAFRLKRGENPGWGLSDARIPFSLALVSIAWMVGIPISVGGAREAIATRLAGGSAGMPLMVLSVLAFAIVGWVAVQGMTVLYRRLSFLMVILAVCAFIAASPFFGMNPHLLLAIFASIGLLDYAYNLRGTPPQAEVPQESSL